MDTSSNHNIIASDTAMPEPLKKLSAEDAQEIVNSIAASIGGLYFAIYHIWLDNNTFICYRQHEADALSIIGERGVYTQSWKTYVEQLVSPEYKAVMFEFGDYRTLAQRLRDVNTISQVYYRTDLGWTRAQFIAAKRDEDGNAMNIVLTVRDINAEIELEEQKKQAVYEAEHDPLTGLYNRKGFDRISVSEEFLHAKTGFALIDIDNFKALNDCHGHDLGDRVLTAAANELKRVFRDEDMLFRLGGDELAILLFHCDEAAWNTICSKIRTVHAALAKEFSDILDTSVTFSIGFCFSDAGYKEHMYTLADEALYETKQNGRAGCTLIGSDHEVRKRWRDDAISMRTQSVLEYKNSGMFRMELPLDLRKPRRLVCGEATKMVFNASSDITPEECYQIWEKGVDFDYKDTLQEAAKAMVESGQSECTYLWNHPEWGKIYVRSNGFGEVKDKTVILSGYHHVLKNTRLIEKKDDKDLIASALSGMFFAAYYWNLEEDTYSTFKASPGEDTMEMGDIKASEKIREFTSQIIAPPDREKMREFLDRDTMQSKFDKEPYIECEYRSVNLSGWCRARIMPIRYNLEGKLTHVLLVIAKLDSAKEEELYAADYNKKSLSSLLNNVPGGIVMYEWNGQKLKTLHISECYAREYGHTLNSRDGDNKGGPDYKRVHPDDLAGYQQAILHALTTTHELHYMYRVWNNQAGRYVWVKIDAVAEPQDDGTSLVYAIYTDITEQKELELGLEKNRRSLSAALRASNQLCYEYDPVKHTGTCFTDTNFFGLPKQMQNYPDSLKEIDLFHPDDVDLFIKTAHQMDYNTEKAQCDVRIKRNGEYCWYTCIFDSYYDPEKEYNAAILTVLDISLRMASLRNYEERLRSMLTMQGDVLSMCTINVTQDTFAMVNIEGVMESFVDEDASFEKVMLGVIPSIIGTESRKAYRECFNRKNLLEQAEKGNMHVQFEYLLRLSDAHYEWITAAVDMMRNPISGEIGGIAYSKSSQISHMSNELLGRTLQQDYLFAAVIFKDTDEFYLYDSTQGRFSECMKNFWGVALTMPKRYCSAETMEYLESVFDKAEMIRYLEKHQEFRYACDSLYGGTSCRLEIKIRYLDKAHTMFLASLRNITDSLLLDQWRYDSEHDPLTGLLNRKTVFEKSREILEAHPQEQFVMLHCDIRHFHLYNTFYGDEAGDQLLCKIGSIISKMGNDYDYWAYGRIESDVFCAFFPIVGDVFEKQVHYFYKELEKYSESFPIEPAIGAYWVTDHSMSMEAMFSRATIAAKSKKLNLFGLISRYDDTMDQELKETHQITSEMYFAILNEQFEVYLQPKYSLRSDKPVGAEALVRWNHPERGMIAPGKFIPAFEKNGFIAELDRYMWEHVCRLLQKWKQEGRVMFPVSVNISRVSMYSHATVPYLKSLIAKYELDPKYLELELTETAYMDDPEDLKRQLKELQDFGFKILMDDFGSGYSSLNTLRELPVDVLKLDMKFLSAADNDVRAGAVLSSIVRMSKLLSLPVIAEGVETMEQADYLRSIGCEYVQGYLFARPIPAKEYEALIQAQAVSEVGYEADPVSVNRLLTDRYSSEHAVLDRLPLPIAELEYTRGKFMYLRANHMFLEKFELTEETVSSMNIFRKHLSEEDYEQMQRAYLKCAERKEDVCFKLRWNDCSRKQHEYVCRASYKGEVGDAKLLMAVFTDVSDTGQY